MKWIPKIPNPIEKKRKKDIWEAEVAQIVDNKPTKPYKINFMPPAGSKEGDAIKYLRKKGYIVFSVALVFEGAQKLADIDTKYVLFNKATGQWDTVDAINKMYKVQKTQK